MLLVFLMSFALFYLFLIMFGGSLVVNSKLFNVCIFIYFTI